MDVAIGLIGSLVGVVGSLLVYFLQRRDRERERADGQPEPPLVCLPELAAAETAQRVAPAGALTLSYRHETDFKIFKGFPAHWHQGYGSYREGRDFVWLEYECRLGNPSVVLIQVEGPKGEVDAEWSSEKESLFKRVDRALERLGERLPWSYERGRNATIDRVRAHSCTSVLAIDTGVPVQTSAIDTARAAINAVHDVIGPDLDAAWRSWWQDGGREFVESRCGVGV